MHWELEGIQSLKLRPFGPIPPTATRRAPPSNAPRVATVSETVSPPVPLT